MKYFRDNYMTKGAVMELIERKMPKMVITDEKIDKETVIMQGYFISPLAEYAPELFEQRNVTVATWLGIFPKKNPPGKHRPLVVNLAATGDHSYFWRQTSMANRLAEQGISTILLENPFYGSRKPREQMRSSLRNVCDLFVMGGSLIAECCFLLRWAEERGFDLLGLTGVSMGGHMASLAATNMDRPVVLVPCLSGVSAAPIYTMGALSYAIIWDVLKKELETAQFRQSIQDIPGCDWLERMEEDKTLSEMFEAKERRLMWILMDYFTSLAEYPPPNDPRLAKAVIAETDAYVLSTETIPEFKTIWPGSTQQIIPNMGHVQGFLEWGVFRKAILEQFKLAESYGPIIKRA